jgi:hypothetical protein
LECREYQVTGKRKKSNAMALTQASSVKTPRVLDLAARHTLCRGFVKRSREFVGKEVLHVGRQRRISHLQDIPRHCHEVFQLLRLGPCGFEHCEVRLRIAHAEMDAALSYQPKG